MHTPSHWLPWLQGPPREFFGKLFGHVLLIRRIRKSSANTLLVREFLTIPLLLIAPFLWVYRAKLWFLCHHNLSVAVGRRSHRWALRVLSNTGFRFAVFENILAWRATGAPLVPRNIIAVPAPVLTVPANDHPTHLSNRIVIAFVGNYRAEKSPSWALDAIRHDLGKQIPSEEFQLLVASPNAEFRREWGDRALTIDTSSYVRYIYALACSDILVLPYDPHAYAYRISGVVTEAVACGCTIVIPDLPVLREQILEPEPIGSCYKEPAELVPAVIQAIKLRRHQRFAGALQAHRLHRCPTSLQTSLRKMLSS